MKRYEITIKPLTGFGTPLKGDTLFGHFCWQAAYDSGLLEGGLERWISCYAEQPFAVFSSAWPKVCNNGKWFYALKRPDLPLLRLFPESAGDKRKSMTERKKNAARKWILVSEDLRLSFLADRYATDQDLLDIMGKGSLHGEKKRLRDRGGRALKKEFLQPHNTINRMTMTTGEGMFAPYVQSADVYWPDIQLAVFVLTDEKATDIARISEAFKRVGQFGFGKDASTGWGRFEVVGFEEKKINSLDQADACYTLGPSIPDRGAFGNVFFTPFTRYGRHGDVMARSVNPFKNPVIMADEGAVLIPDNKDVFTRPYLGRPAQNVSKSLPETVVQGYAPYLAFKLEI